MKNLILGIIIIIQIPVFGQTQLEMPPNGEAGNCYAKAFFDDEFEKDEMTLLMYMGSEKKDIELDTLYFKLREETNQLIYIGWIEDLKKLNLDKDSDEIEKFIFVQDTSETKEIAEETIEYLELIKENKVTKWTQVLCNNEIPNYLIEIQEELEEREYLSKPFEPVFGSRTKEAMKKFQRDNNLPIGQVDLETLEELRIRKK